MKDEEIDYILAHEDELIPSSGFTASVMQRIHEEIASPGSISLPPISFPWRRAVPGMVLAGVGLAWGIIEMSRQAMAAAQTAHSVALTIPETFVRPVEGMAWAVGALAISLLSWKLVRSGSASGLL